MANETVFSVVLPTYNRADVVMEAVRSVLDQSHSSFELIVVDDASTDGTRDLVEGVGDSRVRVVDNTHTHGTSGARNTGIDEAQNDWLCQIDSDDLWPPDFLAGLAAAIRTAPAAVGIVYGNHVMLDGQTGAVKRVFRATRRGQVRDAFLGQHFIHHCASAIRTAALREVGGYDESFRCKVDSDLLLRLTERYEVLPVPSVSYHYRVGRADHLSLDPAKFLWCYRQYMVKHEALLAEHPRARWRLSGNVLLLSVRAHAWGSAGAAWVAVAPAALGAPGIFADVHRGLATTLVEMAKSAILPVLKWLGFRRGRT